MDCDEERVDSVNDSVALFDVLARSERLHFAHTDTNILEAATRSFRSLLLTISFMRLPRCVRNDTGLFENG